MKPFAKSIIINLLLVLLGIGLSAVALVALFSWWWSPFFASLGEANFLPAWLGFIFLAVLFFGLLTLKTKGTILQNITTALGLAMIIVAFLPSIFGLESYGDNTIMSLIFVILGVQLIYARKVGYLVALMSLVASVEISLVFFFLAMISIT